MRSNAQRCLVPTVCIMPSLCKGWARMEEEEEEGSRRNYRVGARFVNVRELFFSRGLAFAGQNWGLTCLKLWQIVENGWGYEEVRVWKLKNVWICRLSKTSIHWFPALSRWRHHSCSTVNSGDDFVFHATKLQPQNMFCTKHDPWLDFASETIMFFVFVPGFFIIWMKSHIYL